MKCYEIKAKDEISEIWLYEEIGFWGVGAKDFMAELNGIKSPKIDLHINSPGGEVFDGIAIYNGIKNHSAKVTTFIDGIAASIASVVALAGDTVTMAENAMFMMHNPSGLVLGGAADMRKVADSLDKVRDSMVGIYSAKSKKPDAEIIAMLDEESWLDADEAQEAGFADVVSGKMDLAACAKFMPIMTKLGFKHIPQRITAHRALPSARDVERLLREAGFSSKQARAILAEGYSDEHRDGVAAEQTPAVAEPPRDVVRPTPARRDRTADLLIKAERMAPTPS